jgi:hypothetical protein
LATGAGAPGAGVGTAGLGKEPNLIFRGAISLKIALWI